MILNVYWFIHTNIIHVPTLLLYLVLVMDRLVQVSGHEVLDQRLRIGYVFWANFIDSD